MFCFALVDIFLIWNLGAFSLCFILCFEKFVWDIIVPIAEDTMYIRNRVKRPQTWSWHECLRTSFHSSRRCHSRFRGREAPSKPTQPWLLWTRSMTRWYHIPGVASVLGSNWQYSNWSCDPLSKREIVPGNGTLANYLLQLNLQLSL